MNNVLLYCNNLCKYYQEGKIQTNILHNINFKINKGEMIAIIGNSGSGKSTLLHLLGGLDEPTSGEIIFSGQIMNKMSSMTKAILRNSEIGFVYQFHHLLSDFTVLENVAMPLLIGKKGLSEVIAKANCMLKTVGLGLYGDHYPSELSGGERQRVAIARALVNNPKLVLADEPTGNLDTHNTNNIFQLLSELNTIYKTAFLVVTHDLQLAGRMDRRLIMYDGQLKDESSL